MVQASDLSVFAAQYHKVPNARTKSKISSFLSLFNKRKKDIFLYLPLSSRQLPLVVVVEQESYDSPYIKNRSPRNGPRRDNL